MRERVSACATDGVKARFDDAEGWLEASLEPSSCASACARWPESEQTRVRGCLAQTACGEQLGCLFGPRDPSTRAATTTKRAADGAELVAIPAGPFLRGSAFGRAEPDEQPAREITLAAYSIDKTEVSVAQYRKCFLAGACTPPALDLGCNWKETTRESHPVNCITWYQAEKYCQWAGAKLPTEAQWEKAARGTDGALFPWGWFFPSCDYANWNDRRLGGGCGKSSTWPVGSFPLGASPYGVDDLAGNVWEWVVDDYDKGFYATSSDTNPVKGPKGTMGILRGGGYGSDGWEGWRAANRFAFNKLNQTAGIGFRCVVEGG
jgi:formylglycine-generating enzyme required for sulfatase activity